MENKYYVPQIEEFYVGFEYERLYDENDLLYEWEKLVFDADDEYLTLSQIANEIDFDQIRVKVLDKSDVESLGFRITKEYSIEFEAQLHIDDYSFYDLTYEWDEQRLIIERFYQSKLVAAKLDDGTYDSHTVFNGTIKNKSEFKQVLKMLNIL
jgi:hypothetical protein